MPLYRSPNATTVLTDGGQRVAFTAIDVEDRSVRGPRSGSALGVGAEKLEARAFERRPTRHRSLASPLAVQCELPPPPPPPRSEHTDRHRRCPPCRQCRPPSQPPAARHPRAQVSTRGCRPTRRRRFAARRTAKAAAADRDRKRRRRQRQRARGARAPFFIGLIQKPVESRARSRTRWPPRAHRCVSRRPLIQLCSEERSPDEAEKSDDAGKVEIASEEEGGRRGGQI